MAVVCGKEDFMKKVFKERRNLSNQKEALDRFMSELDNVIEDVLKVSYKITMLRPDKHNQKLITKFYNDYQKIIEIRNMILSSSAFTSILTDENIKKLNSVLDLIRSLESVMREYFSSKTNSDKNKHKKASGVLPFYIFRSVVYGA